MTRLSVNLNKIALIRNSRGTNHPNLIAFAKDCERFGAEGITVHPRPDQRHVKYEDLAELKNQIRTELNIEGFPSPDFLEQIKRICPAQCTLVPDKPDALTSHEGWDTLHHKTFLTHVIQELKNFDIRVSLFIEPIEQLVEGAKNVGADAVELYTGPYAVNFITHPRKAIEKYQYAAEFASQIGLKINAGHDLNLNNLSFFKKNVKPLHEVSIGHALICDALYLGIENTIQRYKSALQNPTAE